MGWSVSKLWPFYKWTPTSDSPHNSYTATTWSNTHTITVTVPMAPDGRDVLMERLVAQVDNECMDDGEFREWVRTALSTTPFHGASGSRVYQKPKPSHRSLLDDFLS